MNSSVLATGADGSGSSVSVGTSSTEASVVCTIAAIALSLACSTVASAQEAKPSSSGGDAETAQQLSNPLASIVSVPVQSNFDFGGVGGSSRYVANIQPVVPIRLNDRFDLITRTIVPVVASAGGHGLGDVTESLFLSPRASTDGVTYGFGPVVLVPTATERALGSGQLGLGPTGIVVKKAGRVLVGFLANQVWGVAGSRRAEGRVDSTFLQPFTSYTWPGRTTLGMNVESSYDWRARRWTVPINVLVSQLVTIGRQPIQFGIGPRYIPVRPGSAPSVGFRFNVTFVFASG